MVVESSGTGYAGYWRQVGVHIIEGATDWLFVSDRSGVVPGLCYEGVILSDGLTSAISGYCWQQGSICDSCSFRSTITERYEDDFLAQTTNRHCHFVGS